MKLHDLTIKQFLADLASDKPAPGGGAAVAFCAAQGSALLAMSLAVSGHDSKKIPLAEFSALVKTLENAVLQFARLADDDALVFENVMAAYKLPKSTDEEKALRGKTIQNGYQQAVVPPLETMDLAGKIMDLTSKVIAASKKSVISDAAIGLDLLFAALESSRHNVTINLNYIQDQDFKKTIEQRLLALTTGRDTLRKALQATIEKVLVTK